MKITRIKLSTIEYVTETGKIITRTVSPQELAGLKRSKEFKKKISLKKISEIEIKIKSL
jgi:hypothetical protein